MGLIGYYQDHTAPLGLSLFSEDIVEITARKIEPSFSDLRSKQPPPDFKNRLIEYITVNLNHLSFSEDFLTHVVSV